MQYEFGDLPTPGVPLPVELITEIFLFCAPTLAELHDRPLKDLPPLLLTRVCRDWRSIALSIPELWQTVHCTIPAVTWEAAATTGNAKTALAFLELWLSRAQAQPLDVSVTVDSGNLGVAESDERALAQILGRRRTQWRELVFKFPFASPDAVAGLNDSDSNADSELPLLRRLSLDVAPNWGWLDPTTAGGSEMGVVTTFSNAPSLRELSLGYNARPRQFELPYHQLTSLVLAKTRPQELLACLLKTPQLVSCIADVDSADAPSLGVLPANTVPRLTTFSLRGANLTLHILGLLTLPALESLSLAERTGLNAEDFIALGSFLERSSMSVIHSLRRLRLYFIPRATEAQFLALLAGNGLPLLESFEFDATEARTAAALFRTMSAEPEGNQAPVLPQLQELSVTLHKKYDPGTHEMLWELRELLEQRTRTGETETERAREHVGLSRFELQMEYTDQTPEDWILDTWREVKKRGVAISVSTRGFEQWV
ncbi:F-box domain-containing protein [Mycena chlorophos]|uniref:F-box domain-containing protein n=1 Tax=Mycena chlorophos TaxID=658473 RepID=A0A8H6TPX7_MYCCL|nr:F-box domain-containing protein [Mycena chlorophos]